jgi:RNA polymerase primary sigma factor
MVMSHYIKTGGGSLSMNDAADTMGIAVERLRFVLKSTESLISLDSPIPQGSAPSQAGKAGGPSAPNSALLGDSISCVEPLPEDRVELSFLRQCLENALSSELSPHERDVVRLRYGLDDGNSRTVKETSLMLTVTASQVRKAENSAFRKLRSPHSVHTYNLLGFLDYIGAGGYQRKADSTNKHTTGSN